VIDELMEQNLKWTITRFTKKFVNSIKNWKSNDNEQAPIITKPKEILKYKKPVKTEPIKTEPTEVVKLVKNVKKTTQDKETKSKKVVKHTKLISYKRQNWVVENIDEKIILAKFKEERKAISFALASQDSSKVELLKEGKIDVIWPIHSKVELPKKGSK
jgi:hypothetical protein